jgi:hypothetical protein
LNYFFKAFFIAFNISLIIGIIDFYFSYTDYGFIGRHLHEHFSGKAVLVGARFHGFAGEPRDAFVFLGLGLALYYLRSLFEERTQNYYYYLVVVICMLLTFSASSYVGLMMFMGLFVIYLAANNLKKSLIFILLSPLFLFFCIFLYYRISKADLTLKKFIVYS